MEALEHLHQIHLSFPFMPVGQAMPSPLEGGDDADDGQARGYRPIVPVTIREPDAVVSLHLLMLVDSGADTTIIDAGVAGFLGIDLTRGRATATVGVSGQATAYYFRLCLDIGGISFPATVGFIDDLPVAGLLGREDVFKHFKIQFRQSERKTLLCARVSDGFKNTASPYCALKQGVAQESDCQSRQCLAG